MLSTLLFECLIDSDIDECARGTHKCQDQTHVCLNTVGNATCVCKPQYTIGQNGSCIAVGMLKLALGLFLWFTHYNAFFIFTMCIL